MPRLAKNLNKTAVQRADEEFYRRHPHRKLRPLTSSRTDDALRAQWLQLYAGYGGSVLPRVPAGAQRTTLAACMTGNTKPLEVYVYLVEMAGGDPYGHAGLILQQPDGSYVRYSQAAANPNLQGLKRAEYLLWMQEVNVRTHPFAKGTSLRRMASGGRIIRIPTQHPNQVQRAVDAYIADRSHYHVITNNCAEFVNDALNKAEDISIPDKIEPKDYFAELTKLYPDCVVQEDNSKG
jgi:hypothetical protein